MPVVPSHYPPPYGGYMLPIPPPNPIAMSEAFPHHGTTPQRPGRRLPYDINNPRDIYHIARQPGVPLPANLPDRQLPQPSGGGAAPTIPRYWTATPFQGRPRQLVPPGQRPHAHQHHSAWCDTLNGDCRVQEQRSYFYIECPMGVFTRVEVRNPRRMWPPR